MTRPLLAALLPLALAACPSIHGADRQSDGSLVLTFVGGYSRSDAMRGAVHAALRAQPDNALIYLGDNGALVLTDADALEIIRDKGLRFTCGPRAGCDGDVRLPPATKRPNPGGL